MTLSPEQTAVLLNLARNTIRAALAGAPSNGDTEAVIDPSLLQAAGCFVSLHEIGTKRLRGCVGRLEARDPLHRAVADSARSVLTDPRFEREPVTADELSRLEIEISLLSPLRDVSDPLAFDPLADGIFLTIGSRTGCFLPQVGRETGWTREQLLDRLCSEKLELAPGAWRSSEAKLQTFTALILGPEPFETA
jgi:AmmeMemoRadiSam system protein A